MSHSAQKKDIHHEISETLRSKERFGESKRIAKKSGAMKDGIYSYSTSVSYSKACQKFGAYVKSVSPQGRYTSLTDAKKYAKEFIAKENADLNLSPCTVKLERCAVAKLFGVTSKDLGEVRSFSRADITRSRERTVISEKTGKEIKNPSTRAGHFSEKNHADLVTFGKGTGMRRSEMEKVRGDQIHTKEDGRLYISLEPYQCKGGRPRELVVIGDTEKIKELCDRVGHERVFEKIPSAMDEHHYRSQYATALYKSLAREKDAIPKEDRYCCRGDLKGVWYDKKAMEIVSKNLGHNRISVIAEHYLREV